jgi:predicted site-specific integrase-resolvase
MNNEDKFISSKKTKEILGVSLKTLTRWDKTGKLRATRNPSGRRIYKLKDVQNATGRYINDEKKEKICYCRVSSKKQVDDLERQKHLLQSKYPDHKLVTDIGSGINWKRKGLKTILGLTMQGHISQIVVAHRDRLCRFAFELLEWIFSSNGVQLIILNESENKSSDEELTDDILSIIHVYSCRKMGKRRYKNT